MGNDRHDLDHCRGEPDRREARRDHHQRRTDKHQPNRKGEPRLATGAIGIGADNDRPERPHQVGKPEGNLRAVRHERPNFKILAEWENRRQLGGTDQINNKLPVGEVIC